VGVLVSDQGESLVREIIHIQLVAKPQAADADRILRKSRRLASAPLIPTPCPDIVFPASYFAATLTSQGFAGPPQTSVQLRVRPSVRVKYGVTTGTP
jgi:hypothetical protein